MAHEILIVDDSIDDIELTSMALTATGRELHITASLNGAAALKLLREQDTLPELVLLDLKMPGMSGLETLRELRADVRLKDIRVVIHTSSSLERDRDESCKAGADIFLHKAFDMTQFNNDVKSLLDRCLIN